MISRLTTYVIAALALTATATSCSKEDKPQNQPVADGIIRATALIGASTDGGTVSKSPVLPGQALDGIMFYKVDGAAADFHKGQSTLGMIDANGKVTFATPLLYDVTNTKHSHIFATYPEGYILPDDDMLAWPIDGKTDVMLLADAANIGTSWDAGTYVTNNTTSMVLQHQLAQINVICYADANSSEDMIKKRWGNITKIEVMNISSQFGVYLSDLSTTSSAPKPLTMHKGDYTDFAAVPIPPSTNTTATAAAMVGVSRSGGASFQLRVTTTTTAPMLISVSVGGTNADIVPSKIYTVKLKFKADLTIEVSSPSITDWVPGYDPDPNEPNTEI